MPAKRHDDAGKRDEAWQRVLRIFEALYPGQRDVVLDRIVGASAMKKVRSGRGIGPGKTLLLANHLFVAPREIDPQQAGNWTSDISSLIRAARERREVSPSEHEPASGQGRLAGGNATGQGGISASAQWEYRIDESELIEKFERFQTEFIRADQVANLREFAVKHMGDSVASTDILQSWLTVNPRIFYGLMEMTRTIETTTSTLVGYYSVRPISKEAMLLLDTCQIDGVGLLPEHILPLNVQPEAVYVGGVAAERGIARAALLFYLYIEARRLRSNGVCVFYTKPITEDGRRLALSKGFYPVTTKSSSGRGVYKLVY